MADKADTIFYGGDIVTMDENDPTAEALAVKGDKILAVGKFKEVLALAGPKTKMFYLNSQTLMPGFIEVHQHAIQKSLCRCLYVDISGYYYHSYESIKQVMDDTIKATDPESGNWCIFFGWDPELVPNMPMLSASFLDQFSTKIPVVVVGQSGHTAWVNHKAFEVAKVPDDIPDTSDGGVFVRDENAVLTGQLLEEPAIVRVIGCAPSPSLEAITVAIKDQFEEYAYRGLTTVTDLAYMPNSIVDAILSAEAAREDCLVRLALYKVVHGPGEQRKARKAASCCSLAFGRIRSAGGESKGKGVLVENNKLWEAGVKIIGDGSPHCGTAAVTEPYLMSNLTEILGFPPSPAYGNLNYDSEHLRQTVEYWHRAGKQIAIHAHGERTIDQTLSVYEQVLADNSLPDRRHRMEHLGLCTEDAISRGSKLHLAFSFFVNHIYFYAKAYTEHIFGPERTNRWTPLSLATKYGLRWTLHQDHPTHPGPPLPFASMKTAVTRTHRDDNNTVYGAEYCVSVHEALKAYTIDAAWQIHMEDKLGSLTEGKLADLVILTHNPYKVAPLKLEEIKVVESFLGGRNAKLNKADEVKFPQGPVLFYSGEAPQPKSGPQE